MTEERTERETPASDEVPREEWAAWCARSTEANHGREVDLSFDDAALGEVRLAERVKLVAIDHDELGSVVALTIRYGDGVVPINYVIAEPQRVTEDHDASGSTVRFIIEDSTRRKTFVGLG